VLRSGAESREPPTNTPLMPAGNGEKGKSFEMQDMTKREDTKERDESKEVNKEEEKGMPDEDTALSYLEEENERLRAELEGMKEAVRVAMNTAATAKDHKIPEKSNHAAFVNMKMLSIGNSEYYKSLKIYSCFDCAECCFPSVTFTSLEGSTYKIKHDCGCCPCCFGFSAHDTAVSFLLDRCITMFPIFTKNRCICVSKLHAVENQFISCRVELENIILGAAAMLHSVARW